MTAAEQFYLVAITLMAAVVLVMVVLVCVFRVVWLVVEGRTPITDDPIDEYAHPRRRRL
jgi:hypothetical protein